VPQEIGRSPDKITGGCRRDMNEGGKKPGKAEDRASSSRPRLRPRGYHGDVSRPVSRDFLFSRATSRRKSKKATKQKLSFFSRSSLALRCFGVSSTLWLSSLFDLGLRPGGKKAIRGAPSALSTENCIEESHHETRAPICQASVHCPSRKLIRTGRASPPVGPSAQAGNHGLGTIMQSAKVQRPADRHQATK